MTGRATVLADFRVSSLSETGASLEIPIPMAPASQCVLSLNLSHCPIEVRGTVVGVRASEGSSFQVDVAFKDVDPVDQGILRAFLSRELERRGAS